MVNAFASNELISIKHFSHLDSYVQKLVKEKGAKHVLLVFDADDTLLQMPQGLGSVGWWNWQTALLRANPKSTELAASSFNGLLVVVQNLYSLSRMKLVSPHIPELLGRWQSMGVTTMVISARSGNMSNATERQFNYAGLGVGLKNHGVITKNKTTSLPGSFYPCGNHKMYSAIYQNGIYYASGQNKGKLLQCFLKRAGKAKQYSAILLIDDTLKNDQDFYKAYQGMKGMETIAVHYTKLAKVKHEQETSKNLHKKMTQEWQEITDVLKKNLVEPNLSIN